MCENGSILITGGLGGLGSAFTYECAQIGQHLVLVDRFSTGGDLLSQLVSRYPVRVRYIQCNLADPLQRDEFLSYLKDTDLKFRGLINLVGIEHEGLFLERTRPELTHLMQLNIETMVDLTHGVLHQRDIHQRFWLINVASMAGFFPMPYKAVYAATKRFIINFSLALREEIREFGNVTALCPAGIATNPESTQKILFQGFWGRLTAQDTTHVVRKTLKKVQRNVPIYLPGIFNQILVSLSQIFPVPWVTAYLYRRWGKYQETLKAWNKSQKSQVE